MQKQTILIVDDTPMNIQLIGSILKPLGYSLVFATNGQEALDVVGKSEVDLILLDVMMPFLDGFQTCTKLKENPETADIPVIFITAKDDVESIAKAFDVGGVDYITKPFREVEIVKRSETHLRLSRLTKEFKATAQKMEKLANTDPLTGIANRMKFNHLIEHQLQVSHRYKKNMGLIFFDIDHFKQINDTYGHKAGDSVLVEITKLISSLVRSSDVFARWGGEEFLILSPEISLTQIISLAEKLRLNVERFNFSDVPNVRCSFGVTMLNPKDDVKAFIQRADEALYEAKETGRNKVIVH